VKRHRLLEHLFGWGCLALVVAALVLGALDHLGMLGHTG
jgi:hypothetical protein